MVQNQSSSEPLQREDISAAGHLGDFYAICRDSLVGKCHLASKPQPGKLSKAVWCELIKGDTKDSRNRFRYVGMDDDVRLNLFLNLAPRVGIGAFLDYPHEINEFTRILCYFYRDSAKYLPDKAGSEVKSATLGQFSADATYTIGKRDYGIDAFFILQLPDGANIEQIDSVLATLDAFLSIDHDGTFPFDSKRHQSIEAMEKYNRNRLLQYAYFNKVNENWRDTSTPSSNKEDVP